MVPVAVGGSLHVAALLVESSRARDPLQFLLSTRPEFRLNTPCCLLCSLGSASPGPLHPGGTGILQVGKKLCPSVFPDEFSSPPLAARPYVGAPACKAQQRRDEAAVWEE